MTNFIHLTHILQQDCQLDPSRLVLIGVSGGPDSLSLLDSMWRLGYPLVVAHLNHGLRPEAEADTQAVREAAQHRGLPFITEQADITVYAKRHALSIEEAARTVRYQYLFQQAHQCQAQAVAVGHTADDQVETMLMHLLRGAGLSGLKGMNYRFLPNPWSNVIALIRPLLGVFRDEVLAYCSEYGIQPVYDRSNLDTTFYRNRIRHDLLPALETYNANIKSLLLGTSQLLSADDQVLETQTSIAWRDCFHAQDSSSVALNKERLMAQPLGIQRRVIRRAIAALRPGLRDIDFATVGKAISFLVRPTQSKQLDLASGLRLMLENDLFMVVNWEAELNVNGWPQMDSASIQLAVPGSIELHGGWRLNAQTVSDVLYTNEQAANNTDPFQAWIVIPDDGLNIQIRPPFPGDRFQPLGMDGHSMKLADFFINVKLPRRARQHWPLVCLGNTIAWVPGYRISHPFRLTDSSTRVAYLQLLKY